ncbi:uncharacterized protein LOC105174450 [Sesamum indicum]|uniref:Uncharacterized protein LOC105174450 n=1 Tax=Sesamum indicum TaxID=4182 RepID=A0A6I9UKC2_SESIN|nr:uncharacterized protein LOC105174450 [Sesamum indicum]XP_011094862.1 uncharacterized protein LOC105174450 [Sesamum indicum]XP_011094864.1 uncharacterized protein LOC105174450 [Sesamum indicum]
MEDQKNMLVNNALMSKPRKKKALAQDPEMFQSPGDSMKRSHDVRTISSQKGPKGSKRGAVNDVSPLFQPERLIPDSSGDPSTSGNEYRALRRKYLLLEEESFGLGKELKAIEDDIKTLEEEKLSLLDELVVLEGLVDPSDLQPQGQRLQ